MLWKDWAGYYAVTSYDTSHEREYFAFRHAAGMIDVTPLYKYDIRGKDAATFLSHVTVRNIAKLKQDQVVYLCWCDEDGKVIDDGTVSRLAEDHVRITSAEPAMHWLLRQSRGYDVVIEDTSMKYAALSVQGPNSRDIVNTACNGDVADLKFFNLTHTKIDNVDTVVSRTGYTGDLGYELWVESEHALTLWDALTGAGKPFGLEPAGLDAMDVTRVEAGFVLNGIDYFNALHCLIESRKSSPYELALGWTVRLKRAPFIGQEALRHEKKNGPPRVFVGLDIDWDEYEIMFAKLGLPPEVHSGGWRTPVPMYNDGGEFVGQATSGAWSPLLKKNLALATVEAQYGAVGTKLKFEVTVEYERRLVSATVVNKPFFDPERKRA
jgi:aminomethyltransferase